MRSAERSFTLKRRSSSVSGSCSQAVGEQSGRLTDSAVSTVLWTLYKSALIKRAEGEFKAADLIFNLCSCPHLWPWTVGRDWKNRCKQQKWASSERRLGSAGLSKTSQLMWFGHLNRIHVGRFLDQVFWRKVQGRLRTRCSLSTYLGLFPGISHCLDKCS